MENLIYKLRDIIYYGRSSDASTAQRKKLTFAVKEDPNVLLRGMLA